MLSNTEEILNTFAKTVIRNAKRNLQRKGKNATRDLSSSLDYELDVNKNSFSLQFFMLEYGAFVDEGVRGKKSSKKAPQSPFRFKSKMPPREPIRKWLKVKGIRGRDKQGRFIKQDSTAFLIQRSIRDYGMKPSLFFTKPFQNAFKNLDEELVEAFGLDIDEFLEQTINA